MSSTFMVISAFAVLCAIQAGLVPSINDLAQTLALSGLSMTRTISPAANDPGHGVDGDSGSSDRGNSSSLSDKPSASASANDLPTLEPTAPGLDMSQFFAAVVQLWQVVAGLIVHVSVMAKAIVQLQDKVSKIENGQQQSHGSDEGDDQDSSALSAQVKDLWNAVMTEQQDLISNLRQELAQQRQDIVRYRKDFEELTAKFDDDGKKFNEFMSGLKSALVDQVTDQMRQAQELATVRNEMTRRITVLDAKLAGVQTDLSLVKSVQAPTDLSGQAAKEARRARILAHVAQRMEEKELAQEIEILCPLPGARSSSSKKENQPVASSSHTPAQAPIAVAETSASVEEKESQTDSTETVEPGALQSASAASQMKESKGKGKEHEGKEPKDKDPEAGSSEVVVQPGAGPSAQTSGLLQRRKSMLPGPRKSLLPAPRKSLLPTPLGHSNAGNVSNVVKPVDRAQPESVTRKTAPTSPVTTRRVPLEPTAVPRNEVASPLPASSSLADLDAAVKGSQCDIIITLTTADDSMSFLDTSFSTVPPFGTLAREKDNDDNLYMAARKRTIVKPSRRL